MQLSIIIVNYNVKYFLEQCLYSVTKACKNIDAEIFVVDNNSTDGSENFFSGKFPVVKFIWNKENVGYAKANNQALLKCQGENILFLNPDTILPEDCLEKCVRYIQSQQMPGGLGIRLIDGAGKFLRESKRAFPSPLTSLFKLAGFAGLFPHSKLFARYYLGNLDEHKNYEVDVLVGAFMLVPKKILDITGGFDEQFFMYGEDIDLSYRIQKAGFKNYYYSEITAIHFKGESTKKGSLDYIKLFYKAMGIFVKKHYSNGNAGMFNVLMQLAIWIRAIISGIAGFFKMIAYWFIPAKKTKPVQALVVSSDDEYNQLLTAMQTNNTLIKIVGRISITGNERDSIGSLSQLPAVIKKHNANEIIFYEGVLSFKKIINVMEQLPGTVSYKFYNPAGNSIIGSDDKNSGGDCIVLK